jgi:hypothetical protein
VFAIADDAGECELLDFCERVGRDNPAGLAKIVAFLGRAAQRGPATNPEQFRPIKGSSELYEFKPKPFRVLCFFDGSRVIVCTHAFKKKEKIAAEIRSAERQKAEYFAAKGRRELRIEE